LAVKQSVSWWCIANRGIDARALLRDVKAIGLDAVELMPEHDLDLAVDAGLQIATHGGHASIDKGLNDPAEHGRIEDEIGANLEIAKRYKIPNLIVFAGNRRPGVSDAEAAEHTVAGLSRVAAAAESANVTLVLELLNSRVDHPGYQADSTCWAVDVCKQAGSSRVKLLYDIYHMQIMEGDLIRTIQSHGQSFAHYHTAGNPGRHELNDSQEINYGAVLRAIAQTGYDSFIGHEFIPTGDVLTSLNDAFRLCADSFNLGSSPRS